MDVTRNEERDEEVVEQVKELLFDELEEAIDQDGTIIETEMRSENTETIRRMGSAGPAGVSQRFVRTIDIESPTGLSARITIDGGEKVFIYDNDEEEERDPRILIDIEEIDDDHYCDGCGRIFDREVWEEVGGHGDRSGSVTFYDCLSDDCDGEARVVV